MSAPNQVINYTPSAPDNGCAVTGYERRYVILSVIGEIDGRRIRIRNEPVMPRAE